MAVVSVQVQVAKETYELAQGVAAFVRDMRAALADGWDPMTDLPAALSATIRDLAPALNGVDQLDDELGADKASVARAVTLGVCDILLGK